jgi:hypothetical protein
MKLDRIGSTFFLYSRSLGTFVFGVNAVLLPIGYKREANSFAFTCGPLVLAHAHN